MTQFEMLCVKEWARHRQYRAPLAVYRITDEGMPDR